MKLVELDGSQYAIKEIQLVANSNFEESVDDISDVIIKLQREQEFNKILDHTGIIRYYDSFYNDGETIFYLVLEYVEGQTLREYQFNEIEETNV